MTVDVLVRSRGTFTVLLASMVVGCGTLAPCPTAIRVPILPTADVDAVLFLIGDAGEAEPEGEPVLAALRSALQEAVEKHGQDRVRLVFLGDNIYPAGLPEEGGSAYERARRRLAAELDVLEPVPQAAEPVAIFVMGNHDWNHDARDGLQRVRNQASFVRRESGGRAEVLPRDGCPGPAVVDVGATLRIVALDTQWWLRKGPKPEGPGSGCEAASQDEVVARLGERLAETEDRLAVVVAHHPFLTGGPHGGETLFLRRLGLIPQDVSHRRYRGMIESMRGAFADRPPLVYAAGHEHSLQLLRDETLPFFVVSGSGSMENTTAVGALEETLFCREGSGFMRLDFARDGRVRLASFLAAAGGSSEASEVFSTFLAGK